MIAAGSVGAEVRQTVREQQRGASLAVLRRRDGKGVQIGAAVVREFVKIVDDRRDAFRRIGFEIEFLRFVGHVAERRHHDAIEAEPTDGPGQQVEFLFEVAVRPTEAGVPINHQRAAGVAFDFDPRDRRRKTSDEVRIAISRTHAHGDGCLRRLERQR